MASRLNPYLAFNGTAREAMEFYKSALGGELTLSTFGEFGAPEGVDPNGVEGGTVTMPLERQMWGDEFGMLTDRFGTSWMVNIAGERAGSGDTASG